VRGGLGGMRTGGHWAQDIGVSGSRERGWMCVGVGLGEGTKPLEATHMSLHKVGDFLLKALHP